MKSVNSFKMTGIGGMSYAVATGDAPAAMNGVVVVRVISIVFKRHGLSIIPIFQPNFPNFFILNGPNTALGHNSVIL